MVTIETLKTIKELVTHFVAVGLIINMLVFIWMESLGKVNTTPAIIISLGSGAVGLYLSRYMKF